MPDTGGPAAAGYAEASGIPVRVGMYRNRYAADLHPAPQALRHRGVRQVNPLRDVVRDRRLVVVDDSIVRGTTTRSIVGSSAMRGPRGHVRLTRRPSTPCIYGIDTQSRRS